MVQWLRLHASTAGGMDFPDQGTKILHVTWHSHTKKFLVVVVGGRRDILSVLQKKRWQNENLESRLTNLVIFKDEVC